MPWKELTEATEPFNPKPEKAACRPIGTPRQRKKRRFSAQRIDKGENGRVKRKRYTEERIAGVLSNYESEGMEVSGTRRLYELEAENDRLLGRRRHRATAVICASCRRSSGRGGKEERNHHRRGVSRAFQGEKVPRLSLPMKMFSNVSIKGRESSHGLLFLQSLPLPGRLPAGQAGQTGHEGKSENAGRSLRIFRWGDTAVPLHSSPASSAVHVAPCNAVLKPIEPPQRMVSAGGTGIRKPFMKEGVTRIQEKIADFYEIHCWLSHNLSEALD